MSAPKKKGLHEMFEDGDDDIFIGKQGAMVLVSRKIACKRSKWIEAGLEVKLMQGDLPNFDLKHFSDKAVSF